MNKTLHKKLSEKLLTRHTPAMSYHNGDDSQSASDNTHELNLLREAAKDLMQPRKETIANILRLAASL